MRKITNEDFEDSYIRHAKSALSQQTTRSEKNTNFNIFITKNDRKNWKRI